MTLGFASSRQGAVACTGSETCEYGRKAQREKPRQMWADGRRSKRKEGRKEGGERDPDGLPHMGLAKSDNAEVRLLETINHGLNADEALLHLLITINHESIALRRKSRHLTLNCGHGLTSFLISAPPCHKDE